METEEVYYQVLVFACEVDELIVDDYLPSQSCLHLLLYNDT